MRIQLTISLALVCGTVLGARGDSPSVVAGKPLPAWIADLKDKNPQIRAQAAGALGQLGVKAKEAVPALSQTLTDSNATVRTRAAAALWRIDRKQLPAVLPILLAARHAEDESTRGEANATLTKIGPGVRAALPYVTELLKSRDPQALKKATQAVSNYGLEAVPVLLEALAAKPVRAAPEPSAPEFPSTMNLRTFAIQVLGNIGPTVVPALSEMLRDSDTAVREGAAEALGQLGPQARPAISALIQTLKDADGVVRQRAVEALGQVERRGSEMPLVRTRPRPFGPPAPPEFTPLAAAPKEAIAALTQMLNDPVPVVRVRAAETLCQLDPPLQPALATLLQAVKQAEVRAWAAQVLEQLGPRGKEAVAGLLELLKEKDGAVRVQAARILGRIGPETRARVLPALRETLQDADAGVRVKAAEALCDLGQTSDAVPVLLKALANKDASATQAVEVLQRISRTTPNLVPALVATLKEGNPQVQNHVLNILLRMGPAARSATPTVLELFTSGNAAVRSRAALTLAIIGPLTKEAVPALVEALKDATIRSQALTFLERMGADALPAVPALTGLIKDGDPVTRLQAAELLFQLRPTETKAILPAVRELLKDSQAPNRLKAARLLTQMGQSREAVPVLVELLKTPESYLRYQAAQALELASTADLKPVLPALLELLKQEDIATRVRAIELLKRLVASKDPAAIAGLVQLLKDPDATVRLRAARDLIETGAAEKKAALPVLLEGLNDAATPTRLEAAEFLVRLGPVERQAALSVLLDLLNDPSARSRAGKLLEQFDPEQMKTAQPALTGMLQDPDANVRFQGVKLLCRLGPAEAKATVPVLIELLKDQQAFIRIQAVSQLGLIGPDAKEAMPKLVAMLKDKDVLASGVPQTLARLGTESLPVLLETLHSNNLALRNSTVIALGQLGAAAQPAIPKLIELLSVTKGTQRTTVMSVLERMGDVSLPFLIKALDQAEGRRAVIETLGRYGPRGKAAIPALVKLLDDPDPGVRALAALSYRYINMNSNSLDLTPALLAGLKDPDPELRRRVIRVFDGNTPKSPAIIDALRQALKDSDQEVRIGAAGILCMLPGEAKALVPVLREALQDKRFRDSALRGLESAGPAAKEAIPALIAALKVANDPNSISRIAMTLSRVGKSEAVEPLLQALPTVQPQYRSTLVHAMDITGTFQVSPFLELSKHHDPTVRMAAIPALGHRARLAPEVMPALIAAVADPDPRVRATAVQTIDMLGPTAKEAEKPLTALLEDPNLSLRTDAALALIAVGKAPAEVVPVLLPVLQMPNHPQRGRVLARLGNLGAEAAPAVPALIQVLAEPGYPRWKASEVLGRIGKSAKAASPTLTALLQEKDPLTRLQAAIALWQVEGKADPIIAVLIEALKDPSLGQTQTVIFPPYSPLSSPRTEARSFVTYVERGQVSFTVNIATVRRQGVEILGEIRPEARAAIPALRETLTNKNHPERFSAAVALWRIERSAAAVVPTLIEALKDKRHAADRRLAATMLGQIGPEAKAAIPALIEVLKDPDTVLREAATEALTKVYAETPKTKP